MINITYPDFDKLAERIIEESRTMLNEDSSVALFGYPVNFSIYNKYTRDQVSAELKGLFEQGRALGRREEEDAQD